MTSSGGISRSSYWLKKNADTTCDPCSQMHVDRRCVLAICDLCPPQKGELSPLPFTAVHVARASANSRGSNSSSSSQQNLCRQPVESSRLSSSLPKECWQWCSIAICYLCFPFRRRKPLERVPTAGGTSRWSSSLQNEAGSRWAPGAIPAVHLLLSCLR